MVPSTNWDKRIQNVNSWTVECENIQFVQYGTLLRYNPDLSASEEEVFWWTRDLLKGVSLMVQRHE